ncbi:hypothetical protein FNF31_01750 [Cafeteria roenbergensis]|nr:hypothetical protein FNF31_01750 [Cafeteria roenbergensis]
MLPVRTFSARGMAAEHVVGVRPVGAAGGRTPSPTVVISTREDDDPLGVATSPCTPSFGSPVSSGFSASPPSSK